MYYFSNKNIDIEFTDYYSKMTACLCILTEVGECRIHSVYKLTNFNL